MIKIKPLHKKGFHVFGWFLLILAFAMIIAVFVALFKHSSLGVEVGESADLILDTISKKTVSETQFRELSSIAVHEAYLKTLAFNPSLSYGQYRGGPLIPTSNTNNAIIGLYSTSLIDAIKVHIASNLNAKLHEASLPYVVSPNSISIYGSASSPLEKIEIQSIVGKEFMDTRKGDFVNSSFNIYSQPYAIIDLNVSNSINTLLQFIDSMQADLQQCSNESYAVEYSCILNMYNTYSNRHPYFSVFHDEKCIAYQQGFLERGNPSPEFMYRNDSSRVIDVIVPGLKACIKRSSTPIICEFPMDIPLTKDSQVSVSILTIDDKAYFYTRETNDVTPPHPETEKAYAIVDASLFTHTDFFEKGDAKIVSETSNIAYTSRSNVQTTLYDTVQGNTFDTFSNRDTIYVYADASRFTFIKDPSQYNVDVVTYDELLPHTHYACIEDMSQTYFGVTKDGLKEVYPLFSFSYSTNTNVDNSLFQN